ncbi:M42 family peptidase [Candidatus Bathyarchaeota archaeon]|nr:M42 family peptidase [Candidatus Bathyarchaeota archaeon]
METRAIELMKKMMDAFGPSGFEREINRLVKKEVEPYTDEIMTDKLGTLAFTLEGDGPKVLLAGHTDEVGFIVSSITDNGYLTFNPLGGWWDQVLLAQKVIVRGKKGDIVGIIASKPPHILPMEDRKKIVERKDMFIDIGASTMEEVEEAGIRIGDPVVPWSPFDVIRDGKVAMGKAFDDRIGTFVIMEAMRRLKEQDIPHPNKIIGAATVQEEVGLRGAQTIAQTVDPDVSIVLEVDIAGDVPGIKASEAPTKMGGGPGLGTYDRSMIPNQPFKEFVIDTARQAQIPLQLSQMAGGGTDAGRIHVNASGCPTVVITVPTRHIHSHVGLLSLKDTENTIRLLVELLRKLDHETVKSFTEL